MELNNVEITNATFLNELTSVPRNPFYFDFIRKLNIDRLTGEKIYLNREFIVVKNMLPSIDMFSIT